MPPQLHLLAERMRQSTREELRRQEVPAILQSLHTAANPGGQEPVPAPGGNGLPEDPASLSEHMEVDVDVDEEVEEEEEEEETSGTVMKTLSEQHLTEDHMRLRLPGWREGSDVALKYWYINQLGPGWKKTLLQWWERCKESGDGRPFRYFEEGRHRNVVCLGQQAINKKTSSAWKNNRCACWDCAHNANPKRPCFRLVYLGRNPSNWIDGLDRIVEVLPWDDQGQSLNGMSAFQYWDAPGEKKKSKKRR